MFKEECDVMLVTELQGERTRIVVEVKIGKGTDCREVETIH